MDDGRNDSSQAADRLQRRSAVRSTKAKATENRERIIGEAARRFRARGFAGIGVAEIMRGVGMTHGGFYVHFSSKEELMQLACRRAVSDMLDDWRKRAEAEPGDRLAAIVRPYLSAAHRDEPGTGCLMAALGPEAAREDEPVRRAITECLEDVLEVLAQAVPGESAAERRKQAVVLFSTLVGAMVAARAAAEPALSDEILAVAKEALIGKALKAEATASEA
jgi:TetR/AcrR family transcriptional regulator, transcriptional repressor for nem operon